MSRMVRNIFSVGGWTVVSRLTGFLRDMALAALLGGGALNDAYVAAIKLPNQFRQIFGEGSFNAAYLPTYTSVLEKKGREAAGHFASQVFTLLILSQIALLALVYLDMPLLVRLTSPGFVSQPEKFAHAVAMSRIMFPYIAFIAVFALHQGTLNANNSWSVPAAAPAAANVCMIAFLAFAAWFPKISPGVASMASWGFLASGATQLADRDGGRAPARAARAADLAPLDAGSEAVLLDVGAGDRHFGELPDRRARRPDRRLAPADRRLVGDQLRRPALSIAWRRHRHRHELRAAQGNVDARRPRRAGGGAPCAEPRRFADLGARRALRRRIPADPRSHHRRRLRARRLQGRPPPIRPPPCSPPIRSACRRCSSTGSSRRAFCRAATRRRR